MTENSTVFVFDDDPGVLESLRWMIEQADFRVKAFSSGRQFLDSYRPGEAGCLLLDVRMPEMSGLELQARLAEDGIELPVIFLTAHGDVPTCAQAFKAGAVDFLQKPLDGEVLLDHLRKTLARGADSCRNALGASHKTP
jgi:two-component system response regulator FixJ